LRSRKLKENNGLTFYRHYGRSGDTYCRVGRAIDFAEAFDRRQALCELRFDGHRHHRAVGGHAAVIDEFESANAGTLNVEKVSGLIYAVVMECAATTFRPI
jgi:hypothetical protein